MAFELSQGAIERMCNGDTEIKPYLQVTEIRLVNTSNQNSANERYRMLVSDGIHSQQGMLATQRNDLVKSGKLQKGSIVQLHQFVCNLIQGRKIIIIIELEVIREMCDPIGQPTSYTLPGGPRPAQLQPSADQTNSTFGNPQYGNPQSSGVSPVANPNSTGGPIMQPRNLGRGPEVQSFGSSYANNSDTGRSASTHSPMQPSRPGFGPANTSANAGGFNNYKTEVPHGHTNTRPVHQQPPPMYMNKGAIARNEAPARIIPVGALNPYQGRWTIKARVTSKSILRPYSNARGEGKVFSFDLLDSDSGEIRVTCFNDVADQFFNQIEVGKVYLISKGQLKPAQKKYNHLPNEYEIMLDITSVVQPCYDDDSSIPRQQFHFRPISDVEGMVNSNMVDIIGIVSSITPTTTIIKRDGNETQKRTLQLKDMSGKSVELTLWGDACNTLGQELQSMCDSGHFPVLAVKSGRVNDFNGKSVGTVSSTQLLIDPDFPEARALKEWFEREGRDTPCLSISREGSNFSRAEVRKAISQIKDEKLGTSEKPDYITVCAHITFIKVENFCYPACPIMIGDRKCSKKVINNGDGKWQCDRCDQVVDECEYRYLLQCQIQDHTGLTWVTAFQEAGEDIMGIPAKDLYYIKHEEQDDEKFSENISRVLFTKFIFKLKVKEETYSDEQRIKSTIIKSDRVNYSTETRFLQDLMTKPTTEASNAPFNAGSSYPTVQQPTASTINYGASANQTGTYGTNGAPPYGGSTRYPIGNIAGASTYPSCTSCGGFGHSTANCPSVMSGPGHQMGGGGYISRTPAGPAQGGGSGEECFKCHQTGHWSRDCPGSIGAPQSGPTTGGASGECFKCHQTGHWARDCPGSGAVNQSGGSGGAGGGGGGGGECFKCHQFGHWARDCPGISSVPPAYGMQRQQFGGH